ncbi:hypothetical protein EC9_33770 [Rosistilla ulvae]|uniref:Uncharacterized protein n=1 Tax=Rosistilla ulvae TaxID=1930277 RepID=A0A517M2T5_9BACT|nr:hypothetical protein EC9_33770 [Rosistilla ulvae]
MNPRGLALTSRSAFFFASHKPGPSGDAPRQKHRDRYVGGPQERWIDKIGRPSENKLLNRPIGDRSLPAEIDEEVEEAIK